MAASGEVPSDKRSAFFHFLCIDETQASPFPIFSLAQLVGKAEVSFLLQVQTSLFNYWVDKLRTTGEESTFCCLDCIPDYLDFPDVLRLAGWLFCLFPLLF